MSRNVLYFIVGVLFIFLLLILFGRRGTATQEGFISPTPAQGSTTPEVSPTEIISPTDSASPTPRATVVPTVNITNPPTISPAITP